MFIYQYLIMLVLFLYWYKASSNGALILFISYLYYCLLVFIDIPASQYIYYYSFSALINISAGLFLQDKYRLASLCSYFLVLINVYGAYLWYQYMPPDNYDIISSIVLIIQLITITPRGLLNGFGRNSKFIMVKPHGFDRFQSNVTMYKKKKQKEKVFR